MIVSVISASVSLYMKRSHTVVARPNASPVAGPPNDNWKNSLQPQQLCCQCWTPAMHVISYTVTSAGCLRPFPQQAKPLMHAKARAA